MLIGKNSLCEMFYTSTEVRNRLSVIPIGLNLSSISSVRIWGIGAWGWLWRKLRGFTKKTQNGNRHTKYFEKLMMSCIKANFHLLICGKILVTRTCAVPVEYVESFFFFFFFFSQLHVFNLSLHKVLLKRNVQRQPFNWGLITMATEM